MNTFYLNNEVSALVSARIQRAQHELPGGLSEELFQELDRIGNEMTQRAAAIEDLLGFAGWVSLARTTGVRHLGFGVYEKPDEAGFSERMVADVVIRLRDRMQSARQNQPR